MALYGLQLLSPEIKVYEYLSVLLDVVVKSLTPFL